MKGGQRVLYPCVYLLLPGQMPKERHELTNGGVSGSGRNALEHSEFVSASGRGESVWGDRFPRRLSGLTCGVRLRLRLWLGTGSPLWLFGDLWSNLNGRPFPWLLVMVPRSGEEIDGCARSCGTSRRRSWWPWRQHFTTANKTHRAKNDAPRDQKTFGSSQERVQQRSEEECVQVPLLQVVVKLEDMSRPHSRNAQWSALQSTSCLCLRIASKSVVEQTVELLVPHIKKQIMEAVLLVPQERIQEHVVEQSPVFPASQIKEGVLEACQLSLESASMIGSWRNRRGGPDHSPEAHLGASRQVVDVPRVGRRTVEQHVELPPPQSTEELVEVVIEVPQQRVQGRTVEQAVAYLLPLLQESTGAFVDFRVPQIMGEIVKSCQTFCTVL